MNYNERVRMSKVAKPFFQGYFGQFFTTLDAKKAIVKLDIPRLVITETSDGLIIESKNHGTARLRIRGHECVIFGQQDEITIRKNGKDPEYDAILAGTWPYTYFAYAIWNSDYTQFYTVSLFDVSKLSHDIKVAPHVTMSNRGENEFEVFKIADLKTSLISRLLP